MGVYNPNAIMPKNCAVCHEDCKYRNITAHKRHKRCPLVEVKAPHGRLVDENDIHTGIRMENNTEYRYFIDRVNAPTVIEAEEGE